MWRLLGAGFVTLEDMAIALDFIAAKYTNNQVSTIHLRSRTVRLTQNNSDERGGNKDAGNQLEKRVLQSADEAVLCLSVANDV